ncbi:MAG: hypothetical protein DRH70_08985 [Candidatus Coatesbacteria bacterium]|nr:MAG: hypothetical protein DRH70_08985 [Candidatus Coatesbacteria bacterium]
MVREYPIKRGHYKHIEGEKLKKIIQEFFGHVEERDGKYYTSYGSLEKIEIYLKDKKTLVVSTIPKKEYSPEEAYKTLKRYNRFLDVVTGYTAKERAEKLKKSVIKGK